MEHKLHRRKCAECGRTPPSLVFQKLSSQSSKDACVQTTGTAWRTGMPPQSAVRVLWKFRVGSIPHQGREREGRSRGGSGLELAPVCKKVLQVGA